MMPERWYLGTIRHICLILAADNLKGALPSTYSELPTPTHPPPPEFSIWTPFSDTVALSTAP